MNEHELNEGLRDLPEAQPVDGQSVRGGFNPQPDPPGLATTPRQQGVLIGLLLPAVQKAREV